MIQCKVLRPFPFSKDGIKVEHADAGSTVLLPAHLVQGLAEAGYIAVALETKVVVAPETKPAWMK